MKHFNMTENFAKKLQILKVVLKSSNNGFQWPEHDFQPNVVISNDITAEFFSKETFLFGRYSIFYATYKKFKFSRVFQSSQNKTKMSEQLSIQKRAKI